MKRMLAPLMLALTLSTAAAARAEAPLDEASRGEAIEAAIEVLQKSYVFPEVAARMAADLRARQRGGEYAGFTDAQAFAKRLTEHLQGVSRDKHLRVVAGDAALSRSRGGPANFGFEKVERLPGNIGYLELRSFLAAGPEAAAAAAAAMSSLADADALIVDLRRNGGGNPEMVALVTSYLFERPTHLNSLYWREGDRTEEFWTRAEVDGRRFGQAKPVFVLTSRRTFSGAEEFGYNLKNLKRATLVGETTGGGAHPGAMRRLGARFSMFVPTGRAVSPITGTNWEGTGVIPDVEVPEDQALERALELAAEAIRRG